MSEKTSFILYIKYGKRISMLTDEEAGQLIKAVFTYEETGEVPDNLDRIVAVTLQAIIEDLDWNEEQYNKKIEKKREAGAKGGEAKASKSKQNVANASNDLAKASKGVANSSKSKQNVANASIYENENENENVIILPPKSPTGDGDAQAQEVKDRNFSPELEAIVLEWLRYKAEKRQKYKPIGLKNLLTIVENNAAEFGDTTVIDVMRESMSQGYQGIVWEWLSRDRARKNREEAEADGINLGTGNRIRGRVSEAARSGTGGTKASGVKLPPMAADVFGSHRGEDDVGVVSGS